jgi:hypothetical protein
MPMVIDTLIILPRIDMFVCISSQPGLNEEVGNGAERELQTLKR